MPLRSSVITRTAAFFIAALFLYGLGGSVDAIAADDHDKLQRGPKVGQAIPHDLSARDQTGKRRTFTSLKGTRGLILLFSRSVDWCIYCKAEAIAWNGKIDRVKALGYAFAIITYDKVDDIAGFTTARKIGYPILSDSKSKIIRAFDLLNENHQPGSFAYGIPHPIIFVLDPQGIIRHRFSEDTYRRRPDPDRVLRVLRKQAASRDGG